MLGAEIDSTTRVNNELVGDMDEFRISDGIRSADWAAASYATQNSPSTYLKLNCEENSTTKNCDDPDTAKDRSGACGFDRDCTPPRITNHGESETPDGFSINNNVFEENQELFNKNPAIQGTIRPQTPPINNRRDARLDARRQGTKTLDCAGHTDLSGSLLSPPLFSPACLGN